jgi:hypothetical protein
MPPSGCIYKTPVYKLLSKIRYLNLTCFSTKRANINQNADIFVELPEDSQLFVIDADNTIMRKLMFEQHCDERKKRKLKLQTEFCQPIMAESLKLLRQSILIFCAIDSKRCLA